MLRSGDPSLDHTENILEFKRIVTNVAIAHVTIVHDDDQIYKNGPISVFPEIEALVPTTFITR